MNKGSSTDVPCTPSPAHGQRFPSKIPAKSENCKTSALVTVGWPPMVNTLETHKDSLSSGLQKVDTYLKVKLLKSNAKLLSEELQEPLVMIAFHQMIIVLTLGLENLST